MQSIQANSTECEHIIIPVAEMYSCAQREGAMTGWINRGLVLNANNDVQYCCDWILPTEPAEIVDNLQTRLAKQRVNSVVTFFWINITKYVAVLLS